MDKPRSPAGRVLNLKRLAVTAIPVIVLLTINVGYVVSAFILRAAHAELLSSYQAKAELHGLLSDLSQAEAAIGRYMLAHDASLFEPIDRARLRLSGRHDRLRDMLSDSHQEEDLRTHLVGASTARLATLERIRDDLNSGGEPPLAVVAASRIETQALQTVASRMLGRQDEIVTGQRARVRTLEFVSVGAACASALAGLLGATIVAVALNHHNASRVRSQPAGAHSAVRRDTQPRAGMSMIGSVLIVDDDAQIRELLQRWLTPLGLELRHASDAREALSAIAECVPSVMLCDVHMPGKDGLWLADRVRGKAPTTAIVLATADGRVSPFESLRKGVVSYVLKPFRREQVLAAVAEGLRWSAGQTAANEQKSQSLRTT